MFVILLDFDSRDEASGEATSSFPNVGVSLDDAGGVAAFGKDSQEQHVSSVRE